MLLGQDHDQEDHKRSHMSNSKTPLLYDGHNQYFLHILITSETFHHLHQTFYTSQVLHHLYPMHLILLVGRLIAF